MPKKIIIEFTEEDAEELIELLRELLDKVDDFSETNSEDPGENQED